MVVFVFTYRNLYFPMLPFSQTYDGNACEEQADCPKPDFDTHREP